MGNLDVVFGVFAFVLWLGLMVFIVTMIYRLVRGVERIAEALKHKDNE
ncbi:MAG: hypothetical protein K8R02_07390 [Anaerohalosphaeraceae bacterium]|nr:hypothetical protein [Anaerohalosphaeraceae bacterium]